MRSTAAGPPSWAPSENNDDGAGRIGRTSSSFSRRMMTGRWGNHDRGIVAVNLALVIASALFAVIQLSRVALAAKQIDERVQIITAEVGPGSNVSRLDETQKLNEIGRKAEEILAAVRPLSSQTIVILDTARSIDGTASLILANAAGINATVKNVNATASSLLPVVRTIHGEDSLSPLTGGVVAIAKRVDLALGGDRIPGIAGDLAAADSLINNAPGIAASARGICTAVARLGGSVSCR